LTALLEQERHDGGGRHPDAAPPIALGARLTIADLEVIASRKARLVLAEGTLARVARGRAVVESIEASGIAAYGVSTGVGSQKDFALDRAAIAGFNDRLITAHATRAPGPDAAAETVRAALALQLQVLATGQCGVRPCLVEALLARLQADDLPRAGLGTSCGMSDIVAMAQLSRGIIAGSGDGAGSGPAPLPGLAAKEALSLINSNSLTLGAGALALAEARRLLDAQTLAAALALEGFAGNAASWSEAVDQARNQPGQRVAGHRLRAALAGSALLGHGANRLLQDPLSFRCVPQIHGAAETALRLAWETWEAELNAVPDNPLILHGRSTAADSFVAHGNMETTVLALTLDTLRLAFAKVCDASNERIHKLQWRHFSGLPTGLAASDSASGGVQFLNLGHIAAAHCATIRHAANPAVLDFRGQVADGVEDVAGNAPVAVEQTWRLLDLAWTLATIEAVSAAWSVARRDLDPTALGVGTGALYSALRSSLPIGREGLRPYDLAEALTILRTASH
jgi:histidine ammonia-lyase